MKARRSPLAALLAAFAVTACGCSSETTTSSSTTGGAKTVALDAVMSIVSPLNGACFPVPDGPDATIPITLAFKTKALQPASVLLRPQGFCIPLNGFVCGHIVVRAAGGADGAGGAAGSGGVIESEPVNNEGATQMVNVLLRKFNNPYQDFKITVELVADDGTTLLVARPNEAGVVDFDAGVPLERSITVLARKSCDGFTSSSSSGSSSSGSSSSGSSSSGSSGGGGMGGAGSDAGADGG